MMMMMMTMAMMYHPADALLSSPQLTRQYGGDFTRTEPLTWDEWKKTCMLGEPTIKSHRRVRHHPRPSSILYKLEAA
jgi:hypothetical protein